MPWPDLSFGYSFLREFERLHTAGGKFPAAPDLLAKPSNINTESIRTYTIKYGNIPRKVVPIPRDRSHKSHTDHC
jgi:hypothetical protein